MQTQTPPNKKIIRIGPLAGIYAIRNAVSGNCYIGSSKDISGRWAKHLKVLAAKKHNPKLQGAWEKYGKDAFYLDVLELVDVSQLLAREDYWIREIKPSYNMADAVYRTSMELETRVKISKSLRGKPKTPEHIAAVVEARKWYSHSQETRIKIAATLTGRKPSQESIEKNRLAHIGKKHSPEHIRKCAENWIGRKHSDEARRKIAAFNTGRKHSEETRMKMSASHQTRLSRLAMQELCDGQST